MGVPAYDTLVVRLRPGADPQAAVSRLSTELAARGAFAVARFQTPDDLLNIGGVRAMPTLLGILLGVLALATITRLLITSARRRRRRDLAVLRTIGFTRRQVRATVAWQAVTLTVVALVIGIAVSALPGEVAARSTTAKILRSE